MPVLVVLTSWPDNAPALGTYSYLTQLTFNRLSRAAAMAITEHIAGKPLPAEVINAILDPMDGVPLYVEELTKAVLERAFCARRMTATSRRALASLCHPSLAAGLAHGALDRLQP